MKRHIDFKKCPLHFHWQALSNRVRIHAIQDRHTSYINQEINMAQGIIKRYDFRKGFGFIADDKNGEDFFFHKSVWQGDGPIRKGIEVKFDVKDSEKGPQADAVVPLDSASPKNNKSTKSNTNKTVKPASLEERVSALEASVSTFKIISVLALAAAIALAVKVIAA